MNIKGSIKNHLTAIIMLVTIITSVTGYGAFLYWHTADQHKKALELSKTLGLVLGQNVAKLVLLNDVAVASDITTILKSFKSLDSMVLFKKDKTPIYQYSIEDKSFEIEPLKELNKKEHILSSNKDGFLKLQIDAIYQDTHLGYIQLNFIQKSMVDTFVKSLPIVMVAFLIMVITSFVLSSIFATRYTSPILNLVQFLERIDILSSLYNRRVSTKEENEFGRLYTEVNGMLDRLEQSNEAQRIAAVAFETQSGMMITDKDQKILQVNDAFTTITGYKKEEVIGQTPAILKSGKHDDTFYRDLYKVLNKNDIWVGEITNKSRYGELFNEHLIIQAVLDEKGEHCYYVSSFLDITEQKLIEAKLTEKEKLLIQQSKMAQMGEMLENIAHQWRQPLSVILSSASGLKVQHEYGMMSEKNFNEALDCIEISTAHLSQTIEDFRDFYKDDKILKSFVLGSTIEKALKLMFLKFKNKNIEVVKKFEDVIFEGYENELIQVFINLLSNSKDELLKCDDKNRLILLEVKTSGIKTIISFKDSAGGIPKEILPNIFQSHFTTKEEDGTGIGLYMSKLIIENMNGIIEARNEEFSYKDKKYFGANFTITF